MTEHIRSTIKRGIGRLEIDRPEKRNAITLAMWDDMQEAIQSLLAHDQMRALVISGVPGHFAAGADIGEFDHTKADPEGARRSFLAVDLVCRTLFEAEIPVIAAMDGFAIGAGLELACACDIRLASGRAKLGITAAKLGITIGYGHVRRLVSVVGSAHALDLLTSARLVSATEAYHMGLVTEVAVDGDLDELVTHWTDRYRRRAPLSLAWAKKVVHHVEIDPGLDLIRDDARESIQCFATEDFREAVKAFQGHRTPEFTGR